MNPLKSVHGTIALGFITAVVIALLVGETAFDVVSFTVWLHVFFGIIWIGLLYYFNFVPLPFQTKRVCVLMIFQRSWPTLYLLKFAGYYLFQLVSFLVLPHEFAICVQI